MKFLSSFLLLVTLVSCSSREDKERINDKIHSQTPLTLEDVRRHADLILDAHPEINQDAKEKIRKSMNASIERHEVLKQKELKIVQVLLSKSINPGLTKQEYFDKLAIKKELNSLYQEKAENIFSLMSEVRSVTDTVAVNSEFEEDMMIFLRDLR